MPAFREWDSEQSRRDEERSQKDAVDRRSIWFKDYINGLKRAGLQNTGPVEIVLEDQTSVNHRQSLSVPFRNTNSITGVRIGSNKVPSGATIREAMLLTYDDIGRPLCIDAEINGVRLLFRWNGSRPQVQYTSVLTADEVQQIYEFTGENKGESPKIHIDPQETLVWRDEVILKAWRSYTGPLRPGDGLPRTRDFNGLPGLRSHANDKSIKLMDLRRLKPHMKG